MAGTIVSALDATLGNLLTWDLDWVTAELSPDDCSTYTVTIRYHCTESKRSPFDDDATFDRLCNELIPQVRILRDVT